jgi:hypothetical protein
LKTFEKGSLGRAVAIGKLSRLGWGVSIPVDDHLRYDVVVDRDGVLYRVQVKTLCAPPDSEFLLVPLCSLPLNHSTGKVTAVKYELGQIDAVLVCWLTTDRWFWLPFVAEENYVGKRTATLRIARSRQKAHVRWAHEYEI